MNGQLVPSVNFGQPISNPKSISPTASVDINIEIVSVGEMRGELSDQWESLRREQDCLSSPYYDLHFLKAVAKVRDDVRVAIVRENGCVAAFLPYQINTVGRAVPPGGRLNDYHGFIGSVNDPQAAFHKIFEAAKLKCYKFHALAPSPADFETFEFRELQTHHLDLSEGWSAYRKWVRKHSSTVKRQGQKTRNLEKEIGPIRFEYDCQDSEVLERLIELKRDKYQRSNTFDILSVEWAANLLRELMFVRKNNFGGILQAMWAGDKLVCVHFGLQTDSILHYWFPIFDHTFSRYSPGTEMMLRVAEEACNRGVEKLDLGYGDDAYKFKFCNGNTRVTNGEVNFNPIELKLARTRYEVRTKLKGIPMKPLAKSVLRRVFPGFGQWNFR